MQNSLIGLGQRTLHRTIGLAVAAYAILVVAIGIAVAIESARLGHGPPDRHQESFLVYPLFNMLVFSALTIAAVLQRNRADYHKRLMLLGTLTLVVTPLARVSRMLDLPFRPPAIGGMLMTDLVLIALVIFDIRRRGKLHPATLWGGGFYLLSQPLRVAIGETEMWQSFARSLMA